MTRQVVSWLKYSLWALAVVTMPLAALADDGANPVGTWKAKVKMEGDVELEALLTIVDEDGELGGTFELVDLGSGDIKELSLDGDQLVVKVALDFGGQALDAELSGTLDGDSYSGQVTYSLGEDGGELDFSAERQVAASLAGKWQLSIDATSVGGEVYEPVMTVTEGDDGYAGTFEFEGAPETAVENLEVNGGDVSFNVTVDFGGAELAINYKGELEGDKLAGSLEFDLAGQTGELEWTGERLIEVDLVGKWQLAIDATSVGGEVFEPVVDISEGDDGLKGTLTFDDGQEAELEELSLEGTELKAVAKLDFGGTELVINLAGEVNGDSLAGTLEFDLAGQTGELEWTGERVVEVIVAGMWNLSIDATSVGGEIYEPVATISESDDGLTGSMALADVETDIEDIELAGDVLTFKVAFDFEGTEIVLLYDGVVEGDKIAGVVNFDLAGQTGELECEGVRSSAPSEVAGSWQLEIDATPVGGEVFQPVLELTGSGDDLAGKFHADDGQVADVEDIAVDGNDLSFKVSLDFGGTPLVSEYQATLDGDSMAGTLAFDLAGQAGELEFTGKRQGSIVGAWDLEIDATGIGGAVYYPVAEIASGDDGLTGSFHADDGQVVDITDVEVEGDTITFKVALDFGGTELTSTYTLTLTGDEVEGTIEFDLGGEAGELEVKGKRKADAS